MSGKTRTVTVRPGMHHKDVRGPALMQVTPDELKAFGDKFIL